MNILRNGFVLLFLFCSLLGACNAQTTSDNSEWKYFDFREAGFRIKFPCEPSSSVRTFQKIPKLARVFAYECVKHGVKFSVSLPERFGELDESKAKDSLDSVEKMLREMVSDKAEIATRDATIQGYPSRQFTVKNERTIGRQLHIEHPRGNYNL